MRRHIASAGGSHAGKSCRGQPVGTQSSATSSDGGGMTADAMAISPVLVIDSSVQLYVRCPPVIAAAVMFPTVSAL